MIGGRIMNKILFNFIVVCMFFLVGCGHSLYHKVQGTGVYGRIPTPNGGSLIEVAIGDMSITSGILRGGATLDQNTSKGGTFGTVSIAKHTHISTVPAMNQGNIKEVLTSPNTDDKTKQKIAEYLVTREQIPVPSAAVTSVNSASATGEKDKIPEAKPTKTGMDNVVDKVAEVAPPIVQSVAQTVQEVAPPVIQSVATNTAQTVQNISNNTAQTVQNISNNTSQTVQKISEEIQKGVVQTSDSFFDKIKVVLIWVILGVVVIVIIALILYHNRKKNQIKGTLIPNIIKSIQK